mmetsp:Transcript_93612/g.302987  ORF Transcript_93612/g.302987 Transcript_93612/m.302987 type:complete len:225 (-) Transcript_93612:2275-2949(-)
MSTDHGRPRVAAAASTTEATGANMSVAKKAMGLQCARLFSGTNRTLSSSRQTPSGMLSCSGATSADSRLLKTVAACCREAAKRCALPRRPTSSREAQGFSECRSSKALRSSMVVANSYLCKYSSMTVGKSWSMQRCMKKRWNGQTILFGNKWSKGNAPASGNIARSSNSFACSGVRPSGCTPCRPSPKRRPHCAKRRSSAGNEWTSMWQKIPRLPSSCNKISFE